MKRYFTTLFFALFFVITQVTGYNSLRVGDPKKWSTDQGTIEDATLAIRPKGLFLEYGLYLTFSSKGTSWTSLNDTLEVVLNFELPEGAIVHDSWLYMKDYIAKGKIMDKWSASSIYEGIVKRRKDPSILSKISATHYELRVFPMAGNETRKVKITYLLPANWQSNNITSGLPAEILGTSNYNVDKPDLNIITWDDNNFSDPSFTDKSINFTLENDSTFGNYYKAVIPYTTLKGHPQITFNTSFTNGIYFSKYTNNTDEGIYQLSLSPESILDTKDRKKVLVLVDYDATNSNLTGSQVLSSIQNEILNGLNPTDSFNLMVSNLTTKSFSNKWERASQENIRSSFESVSNSLSNYSNLNTLLVSGIEFIKSNGNDAKILLISNSDQFADGDVANTLVNDFLALMEPNIQMHISDYQSKNYQYHYFKGRYYYGNEYFYSNLSKMTLGSLHRMRDNLSFSETISESLTTIGGSITSFDMYTTVNNGYCYGRYNLSGSNSIAYINNPIQQVGKYKGSLPFSVDITGEYNGNVFSKNIVLTENDVVESDSIIEKIWAGQYIKILENADQSNAIIDEIIYKSTSNRVLSKYTSFLCLENQDYVCFDCLDETVLTSIAETTQNDTLNVFPNPFIDVINIELLLSSNEEIINMTIVDISGKVIYKFDTSSFLPGTNSISFRPIGINGMELKKGMYLLNCTTNKSRYSIRLAKK